MKKIFFSLAVIVMASLMGVTATQAYFSDIETSTGNSFAAGSLDLTIDGVNTNIVKFNNVNMAPGNQPNSGWVLANAGSLNGFLDISEITVVSHENVIVEPESEAGDVTADVGELQNVLNLTLFLDLDKNGWIGTGETIIFDGKVGTLPADIDLSRSLPVGGDLRIGAIFNWWSTPDDNKAMTDSFDLGLKFELGQTAAQ